MCVCVCAGVRACVRACECVSVCARAFKDSTPRMHQDSTGLLDF